MSNQEFLGSVDNATLEIVKRIARNMNKACLAVEADAKTNCPVDMGILRASINHDVKFDASSIVGTVGTNVEYAPYVHNGTGIYAKGGDGRKTPWVYPSVGGKFYLTRGQRPQPFLEDAKMANIGKISRILGGD